MARRKKNKTLTLFFDFYAINELYLRAGGYREIGYKTYSVFVPEKIFQRIKSTYEETVDVLFEKVKECLARTTRGELIGNLYQCAYIPTDMGKEDLTRADLLKREGYTLGIFRGNGIITNADKAYKLFTQYKWDNYYGGAAWAGGAKALGDLKNIKTHADKVYWIDQVMDLQHNSGHILNKTEFKCLERYMNDNCHTYLDYRARCRSILDFLRFCSDNVRRLVIPRKLILT